MADFIFQPSGESTATHASEVNISTGGLFTPVTTPEKPRNKPFGLRRRHAERLKETLRPSDPGTQTAAKSPICLRESFPESEAKRPRLLSASGDNIIRRASNSPTTAPIQLRLDPPSPVGSSRSSAIEISSDEEELSSGINTAQTTPETSPSSKLTVQKTRSKLASRKSNSAASATTRPTTKPRAASDPTPLRNQTLRPQDVDAEIASVLQEPSTLKDAQKERGFVYVAPVLHKGRRLVKIGFTVESSVRKRLKSVHTVCKEMNFIPLSGGSPDHSWIPTHYRRVERLAHAELSNFVYDCHCSCKTKHKEYFAVDEKVAFGVVDRWARFVRRMPYLPESGALTDEWRFRLGRFREMKFGRSGRLEAGSDHLRRHQRWEGFVCADRWDWHRYRVGRAFHSVWPYRWALCSLIQGVRLAMTSYSLWTMGFLLLMVVCLVLETVPDLASDLANLLLGYEVVPPRMDVGDEFPCDEDGQDEETDGEEDGEEQEEEEPSEVKQEGGREKGTPAPPGAWAESQVIDEESPDSSAKELRFGNKVIYMSSDEEDD
ncbi:hypothetical protein B0T16DRAFT_451537 [Cercophora newfieldiana]|uniref:Bacteriophage T5 Orf172 DNA-binding domain-containing protein n=1 Tax=Cercophora newfieldiana TaxID=92897 RepID=A0AA40D0D4_9PEZI|nr:hypothetical protein B0T16DRAFT_451537 [Cercophora newfieldiana]